MIRTVVAIENQRVSAAVCAALEHGGIPVRTRCRTGAEAIRAVRKMGGGVVICSFLLPDMSANELRGSLSDTALFIVAAKPGQLELCSPGMLTLPLPASSSELLELAEKLVSEDRRRAETMAPKRSPQEQRIVDEAKRLVMARYGISEAAAHRYIQHRSMDTGLPLAEAAQKIVELYGCSAGGP